MSAKSKSNKKSQNQCDNIIKSLETGEILYSSRVQTLEREIEEMENTIGDLSAYATSKEVVIKKITEELLNYRVRIAELLKKFAVEGGNKQMVEDVVEHSEDN